MGTPAESPKMKIELQFDVYKISGHKFISPWKPCGAYPMDTLKHAHLPRELGDILSMCTWRIFGSEMYIMGLMMTHRGIGSRGG